MKHLIALVITACAPAWAYVATPAEIRAECARQMAAGVCTTKPAGKPGPTERMFIAGQRPIAASAWYDYASLYNEAKPSDPAMCDLALAKTSAEPGGDHDVYARAVWTPIKPEKRPAQFLVAALAAPIAAAAAFVALMRRRTVKAQ